MEFDFDELFEEDSIISNMEYSAEDVGEIEEKPGRIGKKAHDTN